MKKSLFFIKKFQNDGKCFNYFFIPIDFLKKRCYNIYIKLCLGVYYETKKEQNYRRTPELRGKKEHI